MIYRLRFIGTVMALRKSSLSFLLLSFFVSTIMVFSSQGSAQTVRASPLIQRLAPAMPMSVPAKAAAEQAKAAGSEATPDAQPTSTSFVDLILATNLERTPQAILKAWSHRDDDSSKSVGQEIAPTMTAKIVNSFESIMVVETEDVSKFQVDNVVELKQSDLTSTAKVLSVDGNRIVLKLRAADKSKDESEAANSDEPSGEAVDPKAEAQGEKADETTSTDDTASEDTDAKEAATEAAANNDTTTDDDKATPAAEQSESATTSTPDDAAADQKEPPTQTADSEVPEKAKGVVDDSVPKFDEDEPLQLKKAVNQADETAKSNQEKADAFARAVTLGNWDEVKTTLAALKPEDGEKVYAHLLTSLTAATPKLPDGVPEEMAAQLLAQMQQSGEVLPSSYLTPADIIQISEASPSPIRIRLESKGVSSPQKTPTDAGDKEESEKDYSTHLAGLAALVRLAKDGGHDFAEFVDRLDQGTTHFGSQDRLKRLTAADLLMKSGLTKEVERFLPELDAEGTETDLPALRIWSQLSISQYNQKRVAKWLEKAWQVNQLIVNAKDASESDKDMALTNLIELSPQVDKELGQAWLNASFTDAPQRGMMILSNLGTKSATMASQAATNAESRRLKLLRLQNDAAENLIRVAPESGEWAQALTLLAKNWLKEAETSLQYSKQNSRQEYMQIDMYGNYYWVDQNQMARMRGGRQQPRPIKLGDILEVAPSIAWQEKVSPSLHIKMKHVTANLHLRINEAEEAFPYIEEIAQSHPDDARDLIHEFLRIWTKNHDPNTDRRQRNPYIYFYGFDQKAEAIPLTRSKQERNLAELSQWVARIRKLPIKDVDENLLANAFTTCHSTAEVFRIEAVKNVFGELENLKPETIAAICQKMRVNLSSNWRDVRNQEAKQTNRREPEVQQEVLRGYRVAASLAEESLQTHPDNWQLHLAKACLMYDENAYSQTVQKSSEFSDRRDIAFLQFAEAADRYRKSVVTLEEKDQSTDVFDYWFYASLGACDLGKITDKTVPDLRQYAKIRAAIEALPGGLAEAHMSKVANNMFTRMSPIKPEIKFRYLRGGFEIVGDHPRAWEASNLYDYYKDLVSEIKFEVNVDGSDDVGHDQPFGIFVNLVHTNEIERESGGFGKYVQNQNSMQFAFNYGRPTEDYRDKFNDAVNQALGEHFEILNVTFQSADSMKSRPAEQEGWRVTPYAYVLLKPNGPEIDRIAPLKLDMDFLDTSGYVVIPIESPPIVIDCSSENGTPRPIKDLQITQTLDERQADEGKLVVEVSATGKGLVPDLDRLIKTKQVNFEVVSVDDQGVLPTSFDPNSSEIQIIADRSWTIEYRAKTDAGKLTEFTFSDSVIDDAAVKFQRYEDADLVEAEQTVRLERSYATFNWNFLYWLIPVVVLGLVGIGFVIQRISQPEPEVAKKFDVPEEINPFTVLTLLKDIKRRNGINRQHAAELQESISRIERFYFDENAEEKPDDLEKLAENWVGRAT